MGIKRINLKPIVAAAFCTALLFQPVKAEEPTIDELFSQLQQAEGEQAARIVKSIEREWSKSGSASADFLLRRGQDALESENYDAAIEHLTALLDHAPEFAHGYATRAGAYFYQNLYGVALEDLRRAIELDPMHFEAYAGMGAIFEALGRHEEAYEAYARVMSIHPSYPQVTEAMKRLETLALGQTL